MKYYSYCRRRQSDGPRWRVDDPNGDSVALCETEGGAKKLRGHLNELNELRVLLAVSGKRWMYVKRAPS